MYKYISFENHYVIDTKDKTINNIPLNKFKHIVNNRIYNYSNFENFKTCLTYQSNNNMFPTLTQILLIEYDNVIASLYKCKDLFMISEAIDWINGRLDKLDIYHYPNIEILCIESDLFFLSPNGVFKSSIKDIISNIQTREDLCKNLLINMALFRNMLDSLILQLENKNK